MSRIVDASVLVKMLRDEPGTPAARLLFTREAELVAPDIAVPEAFNALWKKFRRGLYARQQLELVPAFLSEILTRTVAMPALTERAARLSVVLEHPIYDCLYLALADVEKTPLVSADRRLLEAGRRAGIAVEELA